MYLLISDSILTGCTEQILGWQFGNSTSTGVPIKKICLQSTHMSGWIHPIYKMSSMGLPKMPLFRSPQKGRAWYKACAYLSQRKCFLQSQSSFLILQWSGKPGVRNIKLVILPQTLYMTLTTFCRLTHLYNGYASGLEVIGTCYSIFFLPTMKSFWERCQKSTFFVITMNCKILFPHKNLSTNCQRLLKHNSLICSLFDYLCLNKAWRNTTNV